MSTVQWALQKCGPLIIVSLCKDTEIQFGAHNADHIVSVSSNMNGKLGYGAVNALSGPRGRIQPRHVALTLDQ